MGQLITLAVKARWDGMRVGYKHHVLAELCKQWPERWDEYVDPALWIHRTTSDTALPNNPTLFRLLFGRKPRAQLDSVSPEPESPPLHNMRWNNKSRTSKRFSNC